MAVHRILAVLLLALVSTVAQAATVVHSVLLDTDANPATGCPVTTVKGLVPGVEQVVDTAVTTTAAGASVTGVARRLCVSGALGAAQPFGAGGWPVGFGNGVQGRAVIETGLPLALLGTPATMRLAVMSTGPDGGDALLAGPGGPIFIAPPAGASAAAIPALHPALLALVAALVAGFGARLARQRGMAVLAGLGIALSLAAAAVGAGLVLKDGQVGDWAGVAPLGTDAAGNAPVNVDLVALHAQYGPDELYFRIDADIRPESAPGNRAPTIVLPGTASVTLPATLPLSAVVSDDGLPSGHLTLAWSRASGPGTVQFAPPDAASTTVSFSAPGAYVLRLTASDGALSASADVQVAVLAQANAAPALGPLADRSVRVGETLAFRIAGNDPDPGDALRYAIVAAPAGAQLASATAPLFSFLPQPAQVGAHPVRLRVTDAAGASAEAAFTLTVLAGNRAPAIAAQADATLFANGRFARSVAANDPDGDAVTLALAAGPPGMTLQGGSLAWSPTLAHVGRHYVTLRARDAGGLEAQARFALDVRPAAAPLARDDRYEVPVGQTIVVPPSGVLANDADPNGAALTARRTTDPDKGTVTAFAADGGFNYVAPPSLPPRPPFAPAVKWHTDSNATGWAQAIGDLDGAGGPDVLAFFYNSQVRARRGSDGSLLWSWTRVPAPWSDCEILLGDDNVPVLADVDDDGAVEAVFHVGCGRDSNNPGSRSHQRVMAVHGATGVVEWVSERVVPFDPAAGEPLAFLEGVTLNVARLAPAESPSIMGGFAIEDFDARPACPVVPGAASTDRRCRFVFALDGRDGSERRTWYAAPPDQALPRMNYDEPGRNGIGRFEPPLVVDLDGDGTLDLLFEGTLWRLDGTLVRHLDGTRAWPNSSKIAIADLDGDERLDVVAIDKTTGMVRAARIDGTLLWQSRQRHCLEFSGKVGECGLSIADVDGDRRPDVIAAGDDRIVVFDALGRVLWARRYPPSVTYSLGCDNRPAVYDLDGDGEPEVIALVEDALVFLRGRSGAEIARYAFGTLVGALCNHPHDVRVADVDGDGAAEVVFATPFGGVHVLHSANDAWMPARPVFPNFGYLIPGIGDDLSVPRTYARPSAAAGTNLYGQQRQLATRPDLRMRTQTAFAYEADAQGIVSAPATVTIDVLPGNRPPRFVSTPPRGAPPASFRYAAAAVDDDAGDVLTFSIVHADDFAFETATAIDAASGVLTKTTSQPGPHLYVLRVTDSQGAYDEQAFAVDVSSQSIVVPDLVGQMRGTALGVLTAVALNPGRIDEVHDPASAGQVIGQSPAAGTSLPRSSAVDLVVSKGPAPVVVPFVVGRQEALARSRLESAGFAVAAVRRYDSRPRGEVIAQSPAGGSEALRGAATIDVSAGTGLELRLASSMVTAGEPLAFALVATDVNGQPVAPPAATVTVTPLAADFVGPPPAASGGAIVSVATARGAFRLTATETGGGGRVASAEFVVTNPSSVADFDPMALFARQGAALEAMDARRPALDAAIAANDSGTMRAELGAMVAAWRPVDLRKLRLATALAPSGGFPPTVAELSATGVASQPDDVLLPDVLDAIAKLLDDLRAALEQASPAATIVGPLHDALAREIALLESLEPSTLGVLAQQNRYDGIVGRRLPAATNAMMIAAAQAAGVAPPVAQRAGTAVQPAFLTLNEVASATSIHALLARKLYLPVVKRVGMSAAFLMARDALKAYANLGDQVALIAGASLSIHVFGAPYSAVESFGLDALDPGSTTVLLIGPTVQEPLTDVIEAVKEAFKLKVAGDPSQVVKDLKQVYQKLSDLADKANALSDVIDPDNFAADRSVRGCLFDSSPACSTLVWESGLPSVYTCPSGTFCPPTPVLMFVWSHANGGLSVESPVFMPTFEE